MTSPTLLAAVTLPVAAVLLLAACGGEGATAGTGAGSESEDPTTRTATSLTVVVDPGDGSASQEWTLTCDPAGGTHPDPEAACSLLAESGQDLLPALPTDAMCTQVWGGPQTATVEGTWRGEPVSSQFSRGNGCEIERWDRALPLLVEPGGA